MTQIEMRQLLGSYWLVQDVWGKDFEYRMACLTLMLEKLAMENKVTFYNACAGYLATHIDGYTEEENIRMDHEIRAVMVWNDVTMRLVERDVENLLQQ